MNQTCVKISQQDNQNRQLKYEPYKFVLFRSLFLNSNWNKLESKHCMNKVW